MLQNFADGTNPNGDDSDPPQPQMTAMDSSDEQSLIQNGTESDALVAQDPSLAGDSTGDFSSDAVVEPNVANDDTDLTDAALTAQPSASAVPQAQNTVEPQGESLATWWNACQSAVNAFAGTKPQIDFLTGQPIPGDVPEVAPISESIGHHSANDYMPIGYVDSGSNSYGNFIDSNGVTDSVSQGFSVSGDTDAGIGSISVTFDKTSSNGNSEASGYDERFWTQFDSQVMGWAQFQINRDDLVCAGNYPENPQNYAAGEVDPPHPTAPYAVPSSYNPPAPYNYVWQIGGVKAADPLSTPVCGSGNGGFTGGHDDWQILRPVQTSANGLYDGCYVMSGTTEDGHYVCSQNGNSYCFDNMWSDNEACPANGRDYPGTVDAYWSNPGSAAALLNELNTALKNPSNAWLKDEYYRSDAPYFECDGRLARSFAVIFDQRKVGATGSNNLVSAIAPGGGQFTKSNEHSTSMTWSIGFVFAYAVEDDQTSSSQSVGLILGPDGNEGQSYWVSGPGGSTDVTDGRYARFYTN